MFVVEVILGPLQASLIILPAALSLLLLVMLPLAYSMLGEGFLHILKSFLLPLAMGLSGPPAIAALWTAVLGRRALFVKRPFLRWWIVGALIIGLGAATTSLWVVISHWRTIEIEAEPEGRVFWAKLIVSLSLAVVVAARQVVRLILWDARECDTGDGGS